MAKSKKARTTPNPPRGGAGAGDAKNGNKKMHMFSRLSTFNDNKNKNEKNGKNKKGPIPKNQRPFVPFGRQDRILLIGEGELYIPETRHCLLYNICDVGLIKR